MITSVSVVVILGAIIAAIAWAVLADDGPKPATTEAPRGGGSGHAGPDHSSERTDHAEPPATATEEVEVVPPRPGGQAATLFAALAPEPEGDTVLVSATDVRVASRPIGEPTATTSWWRRLRAVVLLGVTIAVLGAVAAAVLGVLIVGGLALLDQALG